MRPLIVLLLAGAGMTAGAGKYDVSGRILPEDGVSVYLHGATTPFSASTMSDARGRFRFRDVVAGTYTLVLFAPNRGEVRRTIEVGPGVADAKRRVMVTVEIRDAALETTDAPIR